MSHGHDILKYTHYPTLLPNTHATTDNTHYNP